MWLVLLSAALVAPACDSGDGERLRQELQDAQARIATAQEAAEASERARRRAAEQLDQLREELSQLQQPDDDLVVSIPLVGRLTWKCNDAREFSFTFAPEQATVIVEQSIGGETTRKQIHPGDELATGFAPPDVHREWTVMYHHKPATSLQGYR